MSLKSNEKRSKAFILDWPYQAWNGLSRRHKLEIWKTIYSKEVPTRFEGVLTHDISDRYFRLASDALASRERQIFAGFTGDAGSPSNRIGEMQPGPEILALG